MRRLEPVLLSTRPDVLVVVGDVNSTLAAALVSAKLGIRVAHVEAGLRSFDRSMPEEINRLLTDAISDFLFVTEESGRENLLREGVAPHKIHFVGNVMIDALEGFRPRWLRSSVLTRLGIDAGHPYAVLTLHRPSNVDGSLTLANLLDALQHVARHLPVIFPVHPRVRGQLARHPNLTWLDLEAGDRVPEKGIACLEPLGYLDFIALMSRARLVLTDSGGIQEESTVLGVPCLTLRENTERPVTVTHGTNRVVGTNPTLIVEAVLQALDLLLRHPGTPSLWDGRASARIVKTLVDHAAETHDASGALERLEECREEYRGRAVAARPEPLLLRRPRAVRARDTRAGSHEPAQQNILARATPEGCLNRHADCSDTAVLSRR